jgi:hypothetical protein
MIVLPMNAAYYNRYPLFSLRNLVDSTKLDGYSTQSHNSFGLQHGEPRRITKIYEENCDVMPSKCYS